MTDHLSPSQLSLYLRCGVAWAYRYVDKIKSPLSGPLIRGSALDDAATLHYRGLARGHGLGAEEFVAAAVSGHETRVENEDVRLDMSAEASKAIVEKAAAGYYRDIATKLRPRSYQDVQRYYTVKLDGFEVVGYVDLITDRGVVVDTKLKARLPSGKDVDSDLQLSTYAWLTGLRSLALAVASPTSGKAQLVWTERTDADVERTKLLYQRAYTAILAGIAVPADPTSWACCLAYCDFFERCEFGGKL